MSNIKVGKIIRATVTKIEPYGAFVKAHEPYVGLIHISEISPYYVRSISDYLNEGDVIYCKVLGIMEDKVHLSLSIKGLNYRVNPKKTGKIIETKSGFSTLERLLPKWIKDHL